MQRSKSCTWLTHILSQVNNFPLPNDIRVAYSLAVLSLVISPAKDHYITSAADAVITKHPLPAGKSIWNTDLKPIKICQTKHSGQQGLSYRSDGKIFATAGWDAHIRVYSGKTVKELAVLKWHKIGSYATDFAAIQSLKSSVEGSASDHVKLDDTKDIIGSSSALSTVQRRREDKAQTMHWLAVGAKDGKVSLWNIY